LRRNARETITRISKFTGIPISSTFGRLKRLEEARVITRHTSLVDMRQIGLSMRVFVLFKTDDSHREELEGSLMEDPQVNNMVRIIGSWNLMVEALFRDINELESFVEALRRDFRGLEFSVHYILDSLKQEGILTGYK
jgi:Lrp/AsnC family leucine-responsive transcriptional regulator